MPKRTPADPFTSAIHNIHQRFADYQPRLGGAVVLGERALRYWILREIFDDLLAWPTDSIVVGETFDALLLDSRHAPVIYLETKNLGRAVPLSEVEDASRRFSGVHSLELLVFTDLDSWSCRTKAGEITTWRPSQDPSPFFSRFHRRRFSG